MLWDMKAGQAEYTAAYVRDADGQPQDRWVPGGCGTETPYLFDGRWTLYVWNPRTAQHGYLDMATDVVTLDTLPWGDR